MPHVLRDFLFSLILFILFYLLTQQCLMLIHWTYSTPRPHSPSTCRDRTHFATRRAVHSRRNLFSGAGKKRFTQTEYYYYYRFYLFKKFKEIKIVRSYKTAISWLLLWPSFLPPNSRSLKIFSQSKISNSLPLSFKDS